MGKLKMSKPELVYFGCFGRGGMAKLMFQLAEMDFEDTTMGWENWAEHKDDFPLGGLPVLKMDGQTFCQTKAINKYLAKKAGLLGANSIDQIKIDMIMETRQEVGEKAFIGAFMQLAKEFPTQAGGFRLQDESPENKIKRAKRMGQIATTNISETSKNYQKMIERFQTNPNFIVGNSMTIADIDLLAYYIMSKDIYFGFDFEKCVPVAYPIVMSLLKNPKIANFFDEFQASGQPFTGMGVMY